MTGPSRPRRWQGSIALAFTACAAACMPPGGSMAGAEEPGLVSSAPVMRHPGLSQRFALLVVPAAARQSPRSAVAHADEEAYRKRLREIGFDVLTVGPGARPDLDQALRAAAARVPAGAEVALFVLGTALSGAEDVYLMPSDAAGEVRRAEALESEGLGLGDVLRRLSGRAPRQLVVIVDECRRVGSAGPDCAVDAAAGSSGASLIAGYRGPARSAGARGPLAHRSSLGELLGEEVVREGATFLQLFQALRTRLEGSDLAVVSTSSLSTGFAFVPAGFFAGLPSECNRVDPGADAASLRGLGLDPLIRACESAVATWPYAPRFAERLAAAREQRAFQRAVASCEDRLAVSAYGSAYPSGRYKRVVDDFAAECRQQELAKEEQRHREEQRRAEEGEQRAFERAIASCADRAPSSAYASAYPAGRHRRQVDEFLAECRRREVEEQRAYERAVASCGDRQAAAAYNRAYPGGRFRTHIREFVADCDRREAERREAERREQERLRALEQRRLEAERQERERREREEREQQARQAAGECDRLAANPNDRRKPADVPGMPYDQLRTQAQLAMEACQKAAAGFPGEPRYKYQLARASQSVDPDRSFRLYKELTGANYPAAYDNLGWLYLDDRVVRPNVSMAVSLFRKGAQLGDPDAMVSLARMLARQGDLNAQGEAFQLIQRAARLGHQDAIDMLQRYEAQPQQETFGIQPQQAPVTPQQFLQFFGGVLNALPRR